VNCEIDCFDWNDIVSNVVSKIVSDVVSETLINTVTDVVIKAVSKAMSETNNSSAYLNILRDIKGLTEIEF
jgi:hypothetical protein